jgi:type III secretion protein T
VDAATYNELRSFVAALGLTQPRILAMFIALPIFARQLLPGLLRFGLAVGLGLLAAPPLVAQLGALPEGIGLAALILKETALGFVLGFLLAVPFWAFEAVGFFIDNQRGASIGATLNPLTGNDSSPMGMLFNQAFMVFIFVSGIFVLLLGVLYESFVLWPVLSWQPALQDGGITAWLAQLDGVVKVALLFSAPAIVAMFLSELGLALVSRFAPQLQVFFLAMPIKSAVALLVMVMYVSTLFDYAGEWTREHFRSVAPFVQKTVTGL